MKRVVLTPLAACDLSEIWNYVAEDNVEAADRMLSALERALHELVRHPGIGHLREDLADRRHRFFLVHSYLIVYRAQTNPLQVVRILHAARDIQALLDMPSEIL